MLGLMDHHHWQNQGVLIERAELAEQVSKMVEQSQPKQTIRADGPPTLLSDYRFTHT